jgi:phosphoglycolate phosphatase
LENFMTRLAVFDCDGTLVDSQANICVACERAFEGAGLVPPPRAAIRRIVGLSLVEAMQVLLPEAEDTLHRSLATDYKNAFHAMRASGEADDGWMLGVATGKSDRGLAHILAAHGITERFVTLQTADRHPSKPDPAMLFAAIAEAGATVETTAMIGDTSFDMAMASTARVRAVGVAWGYHAVHELSDAGADVVATMVPDLLHMVARR